MWWWCGFSMGVSKASVVKWYISIASRAVYCVAGWFWMECSTWQLLKHLWHILILLYCWYIQTFQSSIYILRVYYRLKCTLFHLFGISVFCLRSDSFLCCFLYFYLSFIHRRVYNRSRLIKRGSLKRSFALALRCLPLSKLTGSLKRGFVFISRPIPLS